MNIRGSKFFVFYKQTSVFRLLVAVFAEQSNDSAFYTEVRRADSK